MFQSVVLAGTGLLALVVLASLSYLFAVEYENVVDRMGESAALREALGQTLQLVVDGETAQRGYVLTGDRRFLGPLERRRREMPRTLEALRDRMRDHAEYRRLEAAIDRRVEFTERVVGHAERGDLETARALVASGEGRRRTDRVRSLVSRIRRAEEGRITALRRRAEASRGRMLAAFAALLALTLAIAGYAVSLMRRELRALEEAEAKQRENDRLVRLVAEGSSDLVRIHDRTGQAIYASPSSERLLGYTPEEITALPPGALLPEEDRAATYEKLVGILESGERPEPLLQRMIRKDGEIRWFETRAEPARDASGRVWRVHTTSRDVTASVEAARRRDELLELAVKDELTGLLNRRGFLEAAEGILARASAQSCPALLVFCDINGLKSINDRLGHEAGDGVIRDAAKLLSATTRESDAVGRLGGDELVVLGIVRDADAAHTFERRLRERIHAHNTTADRPYRVSISMGAAIWHPTDDKSLDALIKEADEAMYRQKQARRDATASQEVVRPRR